MPNPTTLTRVYVIGDSISLHYGPHLARFLGPAFPYARKDAVTEAQVGVIRPQGDNGGDSSMVLEFVQGLQRAGRLEADVLLFNCGLHDIKTDPQTGRKQVDAAAYEKNLRAILAVANRLVPAVVWVRTTPCDEAVHNRPGMAFHRYRADCEAYNRIADQVMAAANVPVIDLHTFTLSLGPDLYCDHVHFHDHIRQEQAAYIAGWLHGWRSG